MYDLPRPAGTAITKSEFIHTPASTLGLPLLEGRSSPPAPEPASITWEEFVHDLVPRAESLVARRLDEETYVTQVAEQLQRVDPLTIPLWSALPRHQLWEVTEFWLAEGTDLLPHDHRHYNGVIFVLEGRIHIRSYELIGSERTPPAGRRVCIRETGNHVLVAGECSTLTTTRDNIHAVRSGPGAAVFWTFSPGLASSHNRSTLKSTSSQSNPAPTCTGPRS